MASAESDDFQSVLQSKDWIAKFGVEPNISQYEEYLSIVVYFSTTEIRPTFEDFFAFCVKIRESLNTETQTQFLQEYLEFIKHGTSKAWKNFMVVFQRQPTFTEYAELVKTNNETDWGKCQCSQATFENYLNYLIARDNVNFDWMEVCGHLPSLIEYMVYLGVVGPVDWNNVKMEKPTFRQVMEASAMQSTDEETGQSSKEECDLLADTESVNGGLEGDSVQPLKEDDAQTPIQEYPRQLSAAVKEELEDGEISDGDSPVQSPSAVAKEKADVETIVNHKESPRAPSWSLSNEQSPPYKKFDMRSPVRERHTRDQSDTGYTNDAIAKWHSVMATCEKDRFNCADEMSKEVGDDSELSARFVKRQRKSADNKLENWCGHCGVFYLDSVKHHKFLCHRQKNEVYRCAECCWDHISYQFLLNHYSKHHGQISPENRPHKANCMVTVPSFVVMPECKTCGYGSFIPYVNSYHSCDGLPVFQNRCLIIFKNRKCAHDAKDPGTLCVRCESYFSPPLSQIRYEADKFIIDVEKIIQTSDSLKLKSIAKDGDCDKRELRIETRPIDEKTSTLGAELEKLFSPNRKRKESMSSNVETEEDLQKEEAPRVDGQEKAEHGSANESKEIRDKSEVNKPTEKRFKCGFQMCLFSSGSQDTLKRHRRDYHTIKIKVCRCRICGFDGASMQILKSHYNKVHADVNMLDREQHIVWAKPYRAVPKCDKGCGFKTCIPHAMKYHQCHDNRIFENHKLRIACPNLCTHMEGTGDFCQDCLARFAPTERRVKYDCDREEFVITVREKLVFTKEESDDDISSGNEGNPSDAEAPDTSDESDENEDTKSLRAEFIKQQEKSANGLRLIECRFCGKRKSKRTLLLHIKKIHCTKFALIRCHLCGLDAPTYQEVRSHWRRRHDLYDHLPKEDVEYISEPYEQVPRCHDCNYQTLIPHAMQLHNCLQLPILENGVLKIEKAIKCEHAQDIKYSYGLGATSSVCADCMHLFVPNPEKVKYENNVFKIQVSQTLTREDPQFQAQKAKKLEENTQKVGMGAGLLVSKKRLKDMSCTDLVTGIELKERYFCVVHAKEFKSAEAQIQHNYAMHARLPITEAYRCFICAYDGQNFNVAKKHVLQFHKDECVDNTLFVVKVTVTGCPKIPMCKTCGFASMDEDIFKNHECYFWVKNRKQSKKHLCFVCKTAFQTQAHVKKHMDDMHTKWVRLYRCFVCGYDATKFGTIRDHINENHKHDKGTIVEEDCSIAVREYGRIPACKRCGYASLVPILFKKHKCHYWPEKVYENSVSKEDKPGQPFIPPCEETIDHPIKPKPPIENIPSLMDLPAIPLSWKPLPFKKMNIKHPSYKNARNETDKSKHKHELKRLDSQQNQMDRHKRKSVDERDKARDKRLRRDSEQNRHSDQSTHRRGSSDQHMMTSDQSAHQRASSDQRHDQSGYIDQREHGHRRISNDRDQSGYNDQREYGHRRISNDRPGDQYGHKRVSHDQLEDQGGYGVQREHVPVAGTYTDYKESPSTNESSIMAPLLQFDYSPDSAPVELTQEQKNQNVLKDAWSKFYQYCNNENPSGSNAYQHWNNMQNPSFASPTAGPSQMGSSSETKCEHCFAVLSTSKEKEDHIYDQHELKSYVFRCPSCHFDSAFYAKLKNHFRAKHRNMKKVNIGEDKVRIQVEAFMFVPLCSRGCGFASLDSNAMHYHRCTMGGPY